ncbi:MAG: GNAT family N-acetyltransferase [Myxococcota bacterium]
MRRRRPPDGRRGGDPRAGTGRSRRAARGVSRPPARRRALAAALQALLARCWAAGCYKIMLLSGAHRGAAHAFYERNGFDPEAKQGFIVRK